MGHAMPRKEICINTNIVIFLEHLIEDVPFIHHTWTNQPLGLPVVIGQSFRVPAHLPPVAMARTTLHYRIMGDQRGVHWNIELNYERIFAQLLQLIFNGQFIGRHWSIIHIAPMNTSVNGHRRVRFMVSNPFSIDQFQRDFFQPDPGNRQRSKSTHEGGLLDSNL